MEKIEVEVFSQASNHAIVRMPGRKFPGSIIQGDSLSILYNLAEFIADQTRDSTNEELIEVVAELRDLLSARLQHYETVLKKT